MHARSFHVWRIAAVLAAVLLATAAGPLRGQAEQRFRRLDVSVAGGVFFSSDWSDLVILGGQGGTGRTFEQVLLRDVAVHPGAMGDLAVTYWRGRYGVRAHFGLSRSCLAIGSGCVSERIAQPFRDSLDVILAEETVYTWLYDVTGVVGLVEPRPDRVFLPYVFGGIGGVTYDPGDVVRRIFPSFVTFGGEPGVIRPDEDGQLILDPFLIGGSDLFLVSADEVGFETVWAGVIGLGTRLRLPVGDTGIGLHIEVSDHISGSPLDVTLVRLGEDFGFDFFGFEDDDEVQAVEFDFGLVHNVRMVVGLTLEFPLGRSVPARLVRVE